MSVPHPENACGGKYDDWLEVNLLPECNAKCAWCVERDGFHPTHRVAPYTLMLMAGMHKAKNVILLGGEPTLYPHLQMMISGLKAREKHVWMTTNGLKLTRERVLSDQLYDLTGLNVSIHGHTEEANNAVIGAQLDFKVLKEALTVLKTCNPAIIIRFNCTCTHSGNMDTWMDMVDYISFARETGATAVRFAELKGDNHDFVNLCDTVPEECGLSRDPFTCGCSVNDTVLGMPVNFRLMCGLQTDQRPKPENPEQRLHDVLYYDGVFYKGWQKKRKETEMVEAMTVYTITELLKGVQAGTRTVASVASILSAVLHSNDSEIRDLKKVQATREEHDSGAGCAY